MENPELADLRHLEVHGSRNVSDGLNIDFNKPPDEPRQLEPDDLERLKAIIRRAGFIEGNEPQAVLHMLLQPRTRDLLNPSHLCHMAFKQALAALLIAISPKLETLAIFHIGEPSSKTKDFALLTMLRRANRTPYPIPYLQNLNRIIFPPDECSSGNDGFYYNIAEDYYHRLNLVRRLPALMSVSFSLVSWNNEAGLPPPPKSANYSDISFTHSNLAGNESDMCHILDSSKALHKSTYTIGGRAYPEGGKVSVSLTSIIRCLWRHRHHLEELDLDVEDNVSWGEIYGNESFKLESTEGIDRDEDIEYEELRSLSLGVHTLCFLARGIGPYSDRLDAKAFSLVHTLPASLRNLRLYGKGEKLGDPTLNLKDHWHEPNLDVDALLENLVAEKDTRLPLLRIEGFDPVIPRAKEVPEYADEDHPLLWK
ncbi:uncharacterized protein N7483_008528 [Penicillium malachiteum]|uniref:uncharacterized protein n=1 Tax=Penicillium malachiteum TaxID=1324776 RepID=UPI002548C0D0|nr:uncharacterized protein N7483_008528 [Penicillium malachiteum]KAJ5720594.1 hypothetical protein N7483_008528 [Penicillium malachiteum]